MIAKILYGSCRRLWLRGRYDIDRHRLLWAMGRGGICAEIGVWRGDFSQQIVDRYRPTELHLVDPWLFAPHFPKRWYGGMCAQNQPDMDEIMSSVAKRFAANPVVKLHRGKSVEIAGQFPDSYFDWVYIDGDHSYEMVLEDLRVWSKKVKLGGLIGLDDYEWRDEEGRLSVRDAIETFLAGSKVRDATPIRGQFLIRLYN